MVVIREKEKDLRNLLKEITNEISGEFSYIIEIIEAKKFDSVTKVLLAYDKSIDKLEKAFLMSVHNYSYAPLGKDLRRNISYSTITKSLRNICRSLKNISIFISNNYEKKIDFFWLNELCVKIVKRLKIVEKLFDFESPEDAHKLIEKDEDLNISYKEQLENLQKKIKIEESNIKSDKEENELLQSTVVTIKWLELASDNIKDIAEMSLYVSTGKLIL